MKKLLIIYALAVAMVLVYFILRVLFPPNTTVELKHFNTQSEASGEIKKETRDETGVQQKFMLLPQK
mgnify:CR=1 FL=1